MGRAIGLASSFFAGIRVAGQLTYIPQHTKNGKLINARCIIPVYRNSHRGTNPKDGSQGRSDTFKLVAWGKLADTCARSLPAGKALDVACEPHSYLGRVYNQDGSARLDNAGQAIEVPKVAFTIQDIVFGEESTKAVQQEIATGRRPQNWNVANHPDYNMWLQILQQRQATTWDGRSGTFGYARVVVPQGPGIALDFSTPNQRNTAQSATGGVQTGYVTPNQGFVQNVQTVANGFGGGNGGVQTGGFQQGTMQQHVATGGPAYGTAGAGGGMPLF